MRAKKQKIIVAMSGGVDSSVAAKILKDKHETVGIFLHFWKEPGLKDAENKCCSIEALQDARRICQKIGISLYTMNFSREFKKDVVDEFLRSYSSGGTPNPCVRCNKMVKLGLLIKKAQELGFSHVASGHYVRLKKVGKLFKLFKGKDPEKDQSYFLYTLTQEQLSHLIFPLGDYTKPKVRELARKYGLPTASKKESQEICFISGKSHNEFLRRHLKLKRGPIKTLDGKIVGEHQGLPLYTIGQRKGIEIGGVGPFYATSMDYENNILYVVNDVDDKSLYKSELVAKNVNWISGETPKKSLKCEAVIRYRHKPVKCQISFTKKEECLVKFSKPQRAITVGQSIVFYNKDEVLGGGIIDINKK